MPYVKGALEEGMLFDDFKDFLEKHGWEEVDRFKKVVFDSTWLSPTFSRQEHSRFVVHVSEHIIFKAPFGMYYGLARHGSFSKNYLEIKDFVPAAMSEDFTKLKKWALEQFDQYRRYSTLFTYMAEKNVEIADDLCIGWQESDLKRAALDIEVHETKMVKVQSSYMNKVKTSRPDIRQSPIVEMRMRTEDIETRDSKYQLGQEVTESGILYDGNHWPDSLIRYNGWIDENGFLLRMHSDTSTSYEKNQVPFFPLYWGEFVPECEDDEGTAALFGGTALKNTNANFDYNSTKRMMEQTDRSLTPLLKTYRDHPGNGIDSIIVHKTSGGGRYQAHYFSVDSNPNMMPPERKWDGRSYERAFSRYKTEPFLHLHEPSRANKKVNASLPDIIHLEEGKRGHLQKSIAVATFSLIQNDKLRVRTQTCPDKYDIYRVQVFDAVCPLTKRPGVAYRPVRLGIFEKEEE